MNFFILLLAFTSAFAKEIALTFDDSPQPTTSFMSSLERTKILITKLKELNVPPVIIFSTPCRKQEIDSLSQIKLYQDAGHVIGNHTCTHPRLDEVGVEKYIANISQADEMLKTLMPNAKFFRYPFLNEGTDTKDRNEVRHWLKQHNYFHGAVSVDNDDYYFSHKVAEANKAKKTINWPELEKLFLTHVISSAEYYDDLAIKLLGRSPKHVLLLHERDVTVKFIDSLVTELRRKGWKIISAEQAYKDPIYLKQPQNTYANSGIISQLYFEKFGEKKSNAVFKELDAALSIILK